MDGGAGAGVSCQQAAQRWHRVGGGSGKNRVTDWKWV